MKADREKVQELKDQTNAATKIQAIQRGKADREKVQELKDQTNAAQNTSYTESKADREKYKS